MNREKLISAGIDYDDGVNRFSGMPQVYEKFLKKFFASYTLDELEKQIEAGDIAEAFKTAHAIKGAAGNMSVKLFYDKLCMLVELLRRNADKGECAKTLYEMRALYTRAADAVREDAE